VSFALQSQRTFGIDYKFGTAIHSLFYHLQKSSVISRALKPIERHTKFLAYLYIARTQTAGTQYKNQFRMRWTNRPISKRKAGRTFQELIERCLRKRINGRHAGYKSYCNLGKLKMNIPFICDPCIKCRTYQMPHLSSAAPIKPCIIRAREGDGTWQSPTANVSLLPCWPLALYFDAYRRREDGTGRNARNVEIRRCLRLQQDSRRWTEA
jgi:hypothetical protein